LKPEFGFVKFSLIVVTTDRLQLADRLFRSLAAQTDKDFEVIFVHGESCVAEAPALARRYAGTLCVLPVASPSPALSRARNLALPLVNGDYVAFPDDDCVYCPDTLERALSLFGTHPEADALLAAGRGLGEESASPVVRAETAPQPVNRYSAFRRSETFLQFYRRRCIDAVGTFDERLGPGTGLPYGCGEDTDYVLRALEAGFGVYRARSVVVRHPEVNPLDPPPAGKVRAYAVGRMRLLRKHRLPLWFVPANIVWPLLCVPAECLRVCRAVVRFRWRMFRARLSSYPGAAG
jgi:GT2 family glycosyltransferase